MDDSVTTTAHDRTSGKVSFRGGVPFSDRVASVRAALFDLHPVLRTASAAYPYDQIEKLQTLPALVGPYSPLPVDLPGIKPSEQPAYWASVLLWHMEKFEERFERNRIPKLFHSQFVDSFHRIIDQVESGLGWVGLQSDVFTKDLAITRLRLLPAGARLIHPFVGLPKKSIIKGGPRAVWYVYGRCGASAPYLGWHLHKPMIADYFNPEGFALTCELTAHLIASDPRAKAALGTSWFYDPKVEEISPRLSFCRSPVRKGAYVFEVGRSELATRNATSRSPNRRALFERGEYTPSDFALVWSRRDILAHYT